MSNWIASILISIVPILAAVTIHELAHGWVAYKMGDPTPKLAGRLTINPIAHLDLVGTIVFIVTRAIGWAKPVPINPYNFKNPRLGITLVSLAGPLSNILLAVVLGVFHSIIGKMPAEGFLLRLLIPLYFMLKVGIVVNIGLALFNLIPIPPLDGSKILYGILPREIVVRLSAMETYGFIILVILVVTGILDKTLIPLIYHIANLLM